MHSQCVGWFFGVCGRFQSVPVAAGFSGSFFKYTRLNRNKKKQPDFACSSGRATTPLAAAKLWRRWLAATFGGLAHRRRPVHSFESGPIHYSFHTIPESVGLGGTIATDAPPVTGVAVAARVPAGRQNSIFSEAQTRPAARNNGFLPPIGGAVSGWAWLGRNGRKTTGCVPCQATETARNRMLGGPNRANAPLKLRLRVKRPPTRILVARLIDLNSQQPETQRPDHRVSITKHPCPCYNIRPQRRFPRLKSPN